MTNEEIDKKLIEIRDLKKENDELVARCDDMIIRFDAMIADIAEMRKMTEIHINNCKMLDPTII